ncbi:DsbA family oxidoreductase [Nocardioides sp. QY071]|uniref:DsbA family oxidoreductase n=1 Tax=Nocardioides sp. QY071 TaxID=3044187 RepID=UPI00249B6E39|nr:DsbA family oxidoreductase [Nocardioides sp. QY071]WGY00348.1 DsbA family oxidoreductase [Nocardioides sp. QY071]
MGGATEARTVTVDVWVDVQCSWCYLNKRRLDAAVEQSGVAVEVRYLFFELGPDAPDRVDKERFLREVRGMDEATVRRGQDHLNQLGSAYDVRYDWDAMLPTNSRRTHRLLAWGQEQGAHSALLDRTFRAYFTEGADLSVPDILAALAADIGLDEAAARAAVTSTERDPRLELDRSAALRIGVTGVPFLVIDGRYGLSGAQTVDVLVEVIRHAATEAGTEAGDD